MGLKLSKMMDCMIGKKKINIIRELGSSNSASVNLCEYNGKLFVSKSFNGKDQIDWKKEKAAMKALRNCPFISQMIKIANSADLAGSLTMVYYPNGDLFSFIKIAEVFEERLARSVFRQCLLGIHTAHSLGIAHLDVKPENLFIDENFNICVGDFGFSFMNESNGENLVSVRRGTTLYMAPEVCNCLHNTVYDGFKADVWSLGCVLFIMLTGSAPFGQYGTSTRDWFYNHWIKGNLKEFWHAHDSYLPIPLCMEAKQLFERIFVIDPNARISVNDLLNDPWLQSELLAPHDFQNAMKAIKNRAVETDSLVS